MMVASVISLPAPLILLVHLHILEYPYANRAEYDHNIFEPRVRGLRERTKLLEDICYFLVGRLEGNAKTILPTYPCGPPSDTVAFRISLAKYLDNLRHNLIYPKTGTTSGGNGKGKANGPGTDSDIAAWWWKDVLVRKSLLEECAGDKFERLLLSVSTHALLKNASPSLKVVPENIHALLRSQPTIYANLLAKYKTARHAWAHSASHLVKCQEDLLLLRERLTADGAVPSKYSSLSTERLVALANSKYEDLLHFNWRGAQGRAALEFLIKFSSMKVESASAAALPDFPLLLVNSMSGKHAAIVSPQPLPIAAAHHLTNLKKLRKPLFPTSARPKPPPPSLKPAGTDGSVAAEATTAKDGALRSTKPSQPIARIVLGDRLDVELRTRQELADALGGVRRVGQDLVVRAKKLEAWLERRKKVDHFFGLNLWQPGRNQGGFGDVDFNTEPTPELLSSLALELPDLGGGLDARIEEIRRTLRPPVPDLSAPRALPPSTAAAGKPASSKAGAGAKPLRGPASGLSRAPKPPPSQGTTRLRMSGDEQIAGGLVMSTHPATLKARSGQGRGVLPADGGATATTAKKLKMGNVPRKSLRFSLAATRRPSLFATGNSSDEEDALMESDVRKIIYDTQDTSAELDQDEYVHTHVVPGTPRSSRKQKVNRIFTGGRARGSTAKKRVPKVSFPMVLPEPMVALPSLLGPAEGEESFEALLRGADDAWGDAYEEDHNADDGAMDEDEDGGHGNEAPSMTLREILLSADTSQFDLLAEDRGDDGDLELVGDVSFGWE